MNIIRSLISLLIVALIVVSVYGIGWWSAPPDKLANYAMGGRVILGAMVLVGVLGLFRLWMPVAGQQQR